VKADRSLTTAALPQALNSVTSNFIRLPSCFSQASSALSGIPKLAGDRGREISTIDSAGHE
jgi:hypothetical protein